MSEEGAPAGLDGCEDGSGDWDPQIDTMLFRKLSASATDSDGDHGGGSGATSGNSGGDGT